MLILVLTSDSKRKRSEHNANLIDNTESTDAKTAPDTLSSDFKAVIVEPMSKFRLRYESLSGYQA